MSEDVGRQQGEQCGLNVFPAAATKSLAHGIANSGHVELACERGAAPWAFLANQQWFALAKVVRCDCCDWGGRAARPGSPDTATREECLHDGCARREGRNMHTLSLEAGSGGWPLGVVCFFSRRLRKRWTPLMSCRGCKSGCVTLSPCRCRVIVLWTGRRCLQYEGKSPVTRMRPGLEDLSLGCASARQLNRRLLTAVR